jgi:hypothetical protein
MLHRETLPLLRLLSIEESTDYFLAMMKRAEIE